MGCRSAVSVVVAVLSVASAEAPAQQQPPWIPSPLNGHWYALTPAGTWDQANAQAEAWGATLVTIRSPAENVWLVGMFDWLGSPRWTGLYQDQNDPAYSEPAGAWKWMSGEPVTFTNWGPNEPNNSGVEDFATVSWDGYLNDFANGFVAYGIAEREPGTLISLRSGQGPVGGADPTITVFVGPVDSGIGGVIPAHFSAAMQGPPATVVAPDPSWYSGPVADPPWANWISTPEPGSTGLYAVPFTLGSGRIESASLTITFAVDNVLGDNGVEGLFLNGQPIPDTKWLAFEAYKHLRTFTALDVTSLVVPGSNTLFLYAKDEGGPAGVIFAAELAVLQEPDDPWQDLGNGLAGTAGIPMLVGAGNLLPSSPLSLTLSSAKAFSPAYLVVGLSNLSLPFKGGVMVPHPDLIFPTFTDGLGGESFAALWPAGVPSGFQTFMQFWIADAAGPKGFAASNALNATTP